MKNPSTAGCSTSTACTSGMRDNNNKQLLRSSHSPSNSINSVKGGSLARVAAAADVVAAAADVVAVVADAVVAADVVAAVVVGNVAEVVASVDVTVVVVA